MAIQSKFTITHDKDSLVDMQNRLQNYPLTSKSQLVAVQNLLNRIDYGAMNASVVTVVDNGDGAAASGTVTLSSMVATDTVTIAGTVFTCVASGATGNQFNIGGSDTLTAVALAAAINGSANMAGLAVATSSAAIVTVTSYSVGKIGNLISLAISAHGSVSGAFLTGGVAVTGGATVSYKFGL